MATRSTISVVLPNGTVQSVYCHWDGYLDGVGKTLKEYYNTIERAMLITEGGPISSLSPKYAYDEANPHQSNKLHSYDKPADDVTVVYVRDRGEKLVKTATFSSLEQYCSNDGDKQEYNYMFKDGEWFIISDDCSLKAY